VKKIGTLGVLFSITVFASCISVDAQTAWKTFTNRAGWSIHYPADWTVESCKGCTDPTASGVYVNFFPPPGLEAEGSVMVEPLADKPADVDVDTWLEEMPTRGNRNPLRRETKITLNGSPALKVRYRTDSGDDKEAVYVVSGSTTFGIEFSTEQPHVLLERLANYPAFKAMLQTFRLAAAT
jgi:hypothetical protein